MTADPTWRDAALELEAVLLETEGDRERDLERTYEAGVRAGRLAATLLWPELKRSDYAKRAYALGLQRGRYEGERHAPAYVVVINTPPPLDGRPRVRIVTIGEAGGEVA